MTWDTAGISERTILPTGYERLLPPGVQLTVRARRRALTRGLRGRILDLGGAESHETLWERPDVEATVLAGADDPALPRLVDRGERFDAVVSVFQLVATRDLAGTLSRIARLLDDDGGVWFLEPGRTPGPAGRVRRLAAPAVALATGWRIDRDIPAELRRAGLSVTDLERHRSSTVQWWLRGLVEGRAHPALPLAPERGK